ncbi:MAG: sigma-54-dependent Fis family transcriptional regulator [Gammaproteobacteria bacterium]|nr:MAG: sigma-54-dependent Fis family transcriptional regulator [Gammaproteobacteria bacterium]
MLKKRVLVVDDEPDIRELLSITLEQMGLEVVTAAKLSKARKLLESESFDLCLTDMKMPDGNGLELVETVQAMHQQMPIAMITAYGNMEIAIEALKKGAFDFISKPLELIRLRNVVQSALKLGQRGDKCASQEQTLIGQSPAIERLKQQIRQVARSQAPVFISGESGSGKELVARAIHHLGPRASGPFVPVNCGAIPAELMESEFFGHKKGSFTGAHQDKQGLFLAAHGGTLLLDEVADLPMPMQVKLLRAIQEKSVRPVGSEEEIPVDIRILSATHKNLSLEVRNSQFRQDLFYRINVIELKVPSLRERAEDIPLLAEHFLKQFSVDVEKPVPQLTLNAVSFLKKHPFPGNIRELENTLERAFTLSHGDSIDVEDLQLDSVTNIELALDTADSSGGYTPGTASSLDDYLADIEKNILLAALERNRWNRTATAEELGISFRQIRHKLKKYGID